MFFHKKKKILVIIFVCAAVAVVLYTYVTKDDLTVIDSYPIPDSLHEISGIVSVGGTLVAAIEDETGTIYRYDLVKRALIDKIPFGPPGDYEDVAFADGVYYVLRSDGTLFISGNGTTTTLHLGIREKQSEGLTYDPLTKRLLIAAKTKSTLGKDFKDERFIYAFDLLNRKLEQTPIFALNTKDLEKHLQRSVKFRPSALAINPQTHILYVASGVDSSMALFDQNGRVLRVFEHDKKVFNQPEGITFLPGGDALISNEGGVGKPTLLRVVFK